jgi:predicted nucleotidyltransferase component of viral defense system
MLHWNTVSQNLKTALHKLMEGQPLNDFRLVGGTALSLYWGHRMSVDIDLFTDATYDSIDFDLVENFLQHKFNYTQGDFGADPGMGKSYLIGDTKDSAIKLDLYYSMDPFYQLANEIDGVRIATVEEILAMKIDVVQRLGRKKDFWDLHRGLEDYTFDEMINFHKQRYEWTHEEELIKSNLKVFSLADNDFDPVCLDGKEWAFIKEDIESLIEPTRRKRGR